MRFGHCCAVAAAVFTLTGSAYAATYYVAPGGKQGDLSSNAKSPGTLAFATAHAPAGSVVILEDGAYDGTPEGYTVTSPNVTFQAQHWHSAAVKNSTGARLWDSSKAPGNVCRGIVFGPCVTPITGILWSGGGGEDSRFTDCVFTQNDGMGFGSRSIVEHCLFTDQWGNSFDVNFSDQFTMRNSIARRGNRANGDANSIGNKEDLAPHLTFDGLIAYDNEGSALWFDTNNTDWTVKNCTLFANHGGNNWYNLDVRGGVSATTFFNYSSVPWASGQEQEKVPVGALLMSVKGTAANIHAKTKVVKVEVTKDDKTPPTYKFTYTVSPALPATPADGDDFAVQQGPDGVSGAYGFITEANPNGAFTDNVTYSNTDAGFYDHASGNGFGVAHGGLTITGNLFAYDGNGIFFSGDHNEGNNYRQLSTADISHNRFKFKPGVNGAFGSWGGELKGFPKSYGVVFDNNIYDPDNDKPGFAMWWGDPVGKQPANDLPALQDATRFDQDHHSRIDKVEFRGTVVPTYVFPSQNDTNWDNIYFPKTEYSTSDSIRQVNDDETPYIQKAVEHSRPGKSIKLTVFGHTPILGSGPYICEVYDYSGRWITLDIKSKADADSLDTGVPGYAVLTPSHITATLTSTDPYALRATYRAGRR